MEGQHTPGVAPQNVRGRKQRARNPAADFDQGSQGAHGQQPPVRKSNRGVKQQQPEVANWGGDYGNADPAQSYPEHYEYGGEQVDSYGYGYGGAQVDSQGYGYGGAQVDAGQGYGYGGEQVNAGQGYGYGGAQGDGQNYGHVAPRGKPRTPRKARPVAGGVYQGEYEEGYGVQHQVDQYGQPVQGSYEGGHGSQHQIDQYGQPVQGSYEGGHGSQHQWDGCGQPEQGSYADGYAYPETHNVVAEQQPNRNPPGRKRVGKEPKPKPIHNENHGDGAYADPGQGAYTAAGANPKARIPNKQFRDYPVAEEGQYGGGGAENSLPSRAISRGQGELDGSGRSRTSQEGSGSSSGRIRAENETRSSRGGRLEPEGVTPTGTPRLNAIARDGGSIRSRSDRRGGSSRSNPEGEGSGSSRVVAKSDKTSGPPPSVHANPLHEHLRKTGGGKPKPAFNNDSMIVFDTQDRTLVTSLAGIPPIAESEEIGTPRVVAKPGKTPPPPAVYANPLNEHMRRIGGGKPKPAYNDASMVVFDSQDRTLVTSFADMPPIIENHKAPQPANRPKEVSRPPPGTRSSLDEWMKKQNQNAGPKYKQDESLIVFDDGHDKSELETQMFGAPLEKKQSMKLPPLVEKPQYEQSGGRPPYQQPVGDNNQYRQAAANPLYHPVRRPHARPSPQQPPNNPQVVPEAGAIQMYDAEGKQVQPVVPNAKCMACVHGIGVPIARIATRIACRQCVAACCCTIL